MLLPLLLVGALGGGMPPAAAAPAPAAGDRWALVIGVDRSQGATRSNYGAVHDAADFRQMLIRAGWADDHINVLTDSAATAAGIRAGMQWLVDRSGPGTLSVLHYSGHVKQVGSTEYLWPHDNRFIADSEVAGYARQQSVFTHLLVEQAMLQGLGDANDDGRVSVQEAFAYAAPRAPQMTARAHQGA